MSEEIAAEEAPAVDDSAIVAEMAGGDPAPEVGARPDWLLDKYMPEGKTVEEATAEQAKAYNELQSKFGAFTGAPEGYELAISDELKELGVDFADDDPLIEQAKEFAKESNMSQDGFNKMLELYATTQVAENAALAEYKEAQLAQLGTNAQGRIDNITQWATKNLDQETVAGLEGMATSADSVKAIERLISMTRNAPAQVNNSSAAPAVSESEVKAMQFEMDQYGGRRIGSDPAFRKAYEAKRDALYGTHEYAKIVG